MLNKKRIISTIIIVSLALMLINVASASDDNETLISAADDSQLELDAVSEPITENDSATADLVNVENNENLSSSGETGGGKD